MTLAYIALGSNLESPAAQVRRALEGIAALPSTRLMSASSLYRTAPVGYADQPDFVNAVACVDTTLTPQALLAALLALEAEFGRVRSFRNAPRVLDLDLLLYEGAECTDEALTLPHPRMHERAFVMVPLCEIAPDCVIPGHGRVADLAPALDKDGIERLSALS